MRTSAYIRPGGRIETTTEIVPGDSLTACFDGRIWLSVNAGEMDLALSIADCERLIDTLRPALAEARRRRDFDEHTRDALSVVL